MDIKTLFERMKTEIMFRAIAVFLILAGVATSVYYYHQYQLLKQNPNAQAEKETASLVATVSAFMDLPTQETPTVATVLDREKLKDQAFFQNAQNGDKLLAYTKAKKAILFRPSTQKIIEVAPISINQENGGAQGNSSVVRVAYYNGTERVGLSGQAEKTVKAKFPDYQTATLTNATAKDYVGVLVVNISGKYAKEADDLSVLLGGKVGPLPTGEAKPDADILIILGK